MFNTATGVQACPAADGASPIPWSINYFTSDNFGSEGIGTRRDCLRQNVESRFLQPARSTGGTYTTTVALPILVSNVYSLGAGDT